MKIISEYPELKGVAFDTVEACEAEEKKIDNAKMEAAKKEKEAIDAKNAKRMALDEELKQLEAAKVQARENLVKVKQVARETMAKTNADLATAHATLHQAVRAYNDKLLEIAQLDGNVHNSKVNVEVTPDELFRILFGI